MTILTRVSGVSKRVPSSLRALRTAASCVLLALLAGIPVQAQAQTTLNLNPGWTLLGNGSGTTFDVGPIFGDQSNVNTLWKWNATKGVWAFYTPTLLDGGAAYAATKGYDTLISIGPGEGFWVNSKASFAAQLPAGAVVQSASFQGLAAGWNLIAIGDNKTPWQFNTALNSTPPTPGVMTNNLTSLWTWDAAQLNWYFYAPNLDADGTLAGYVSGKRYLNFGCAVLGPTTGFWVNIPGSVTTTPVTTTTAAETCTTYATTSTTATSSSTTVTSSSTTVTSTTSTTIVPIPPGPAPIILSAATPPAAFAALTPAVPAVAISIVGTPRVMFSLTDGNNNAIIGFGSTSQNATATMPSYPNLSFTLAKLVPGANGAPSKWVSYIVTTVPTTTAAATAARPGVDNTGTLVDNGNGTYTYAFYRDITKIADQVAAATLTAPNNAADLGDLTYDPNAVHRLSIQISGNAPGTGTNTANGVQVTAGVPMAHPVNVIYDFIPATGKPATGTDPSRDIVATAKCNECHGKLGNIPGSTQAFHGGTRNDARYCVVCHTDQRKFGRTEATSTTTGYDPVAGTYLINGSTVGNYPVLAHKIHFGAGLTKSGYSYGGVLFNDIKYPQDIRNCTKCHDGSASSSVKTANGDNWKTVPSRAACGACHDGINFATGKGTTLADFRAGTAATSIGHVGGAKPDDSQCALCHDATTIPMYHIPVTPPDPGSALHVAGGNANTNAAWIASNAGNLPSGAIKVTYDISSVSVNASRQPVMVFRMLQNGARADFNTYSAAGKTEIWDNFMGSPGAYFVFALPQDGIAAPADFNASVSGYLKNIWNGTATGTAAGTLTGPDANGYYTITLTGVTIPSSAVMLTGGLGYTYNVTGALPLTQTNLADYPTSGSPAGQANRIGGLIVMAPNVQKVATGYTGRRVIVESARCNACHDRLGVFTNSAFHAAQRNDASTCSWCHNPNRTSSGWSADAESYVHAIHGASKRTVAFNWHAVSATDNYSKAAYPGILKNCETCHLPGTYDFSAPASAGSLPNRLYRTVATGTLASTSATAFQYSPYIAMDVNYGAGYSFAPATGTTTEAAGTTLVIAPTAAACFSCHDSSLAQTHMNQNGGAIYAPRSSALTQSETCLLCHGAGKIADIKTMHAN